MKLLERASVVVLFLMASFVSMQSHANVIHGTKWGNPTLGTAGGVVTWGLRSTSMTGCPGSLNTTCTSLNEFMPGGFVSEMSTAFNVWSAVANIQFQFVDTADAMIRMAGVEEDGISNDLAFAYTPGDPLANSLSGDIFFDKAELWSLDKEGANVYWVSLHEIGHAIGILHSDVTPSVMGPFYSPDLVNLTADDIAAAQEIYGIAAVPIPAALWLFISGFFLFFLRKKHC